MIFKKLTAAALIGASLTAAAAPSAALARDYRSWETSRHDRGYVQHRGYYDAGYRRPQRCGGDNTTGLILGGALGALLGRAVDTHGERTTGTVLGAGAGALLGREVAKGRC